MATGARPARASAVTVARPPLLEDPFWFQKAVFYELSVRAFHDDNNDGIGDFAGLIGKLEYLEWLGVDCIWLLPFQQSPLRDGGYDISEYRTVLPDYGNVEDVALLVKEAHRRGIKVIMDLVVNHTSDQHPARITFTASSATSRI